MSQKILRLTASNVKRITAIDITPDPSKPVITIGGKNSAGKTSTMDCLEWAFAGGRTIPASAVRKGARKAEIMVETEEYVIEKTVKAGGQTTLVVTAKEDEDGKAISSPQALLNKLHGDFTFDALAFSKMSPKDQRAMLVKLSGIDLDEIDGEIERTKEVARGAASNHDLAFSQIAGMSVPATKPGTEVLSLSALNEKLTKVQTDNTNNDILAANIKNAAIEFDELEVSIDALLIKRKDKKAQLETQRARLVDHVDIDPLIAKIEGLAEANQAIVDANRYYEKKSTIDALDEAQEAAKAAHKEAKTVKLEALEQADMPVPGLGFDDDGVTFKNIPFGNLGSAEQLRLSVAMAMALNPELHVIRIMDGSLLDSESMAMIEEMAGEKDFQVWIEVVDETGKAQVVIEDGTVAE